MKLLLDTHAFLWLMAGDRRLSRRARRAVEAADAELYLSAASVWEMAIKANLGRLRLPASYPAAKCTGVADTILDLMVMRHVANSIVGNVEKRGIR